MLGFVFVILLSSFIIVKGAEEVIEIKGSFCGILIGDNEIYSTRTSTENECEDALQEALPASCNDLTDWIRVNHPDISIPTSGLEFSIVYGDTVEAVTCRPTNGEEEVEVEVEVTEEEGIFQICGGCDVDGTCYPLGYRKSGDYCSDNREFVVQLEGNAVCENSFECGSNVCVSGQCVEAGLIQKILNWFKRLFGG